jgi:purine nucleoside phosphorylase
MAAGLEDGRLDHEAVLSVAGEAEPRLTRLLRELLPSLAA